jgi:hypothetical protein
MERRYRRCVLYVGGYDPVTPQRFFVRLARELARFRATWNVDSAIGTETPSPDHAVVTTTIETIAPDWTVDTDFRLLAWDDIVKKDFARPIGWRLPVSFGILLDFFLSGTVFRYFASAWRFALYFLFPYFIVALFLAVGILIATAVSKLDLWHSGLLGAVAGLITFVVLMRWPGERWFISHLLDARTFMGQYRRGDRRDMEARLDRFAAELLAAKQSAGFDEIVLVGHSQGSVFALEIAERAYRLDPKTMRGGVPLTLLSVGSCVLQLGLHPSAEAFRQRLRTLAEEPNINWIECQALTDTVNFYKTDPAALMDLGSGTTGRFPLVQIVRIRDMLSPDDYKRVRKSLFRIHYQFVMGNTRRYSYDFFLMCCGPMALVERFPTANYPKPAPGR